MSARQPVRVLRTSELDASVAARGRFQREVTPLLDGLFGHAMLITHNRVDAEDLVQDTLLKAFRGFDTFQQGTNFKS
ncbi:sigma factor [Mycolicibacterium goodii]|uniref:sigma factor n=1 Tax=Mycolicibacterium goodii TaxID=134601 RepID=UPI00257F8D43|nr:sigma factor [Mycolicibacterium goodii]